MRVARRLLGGLAGLAAAGVLAAVVLGWHQGYRLYILHTGSMIPTLRPGEAVLDRPVHGPVRRGEIITFRYAFGPDQVVTHRVFSDANGVIRTKGDANPTKDPWMLRPAQVVGTPIAVIPYGGYVLVYLSQPAGASSVLVSTLAIWLLWGLCFPPGTGEPGQAPGQAPSPAPDRAQGRAPDRAPDRAEGRHRPAHARHPAAPRSSRAPAPAFPGPEPDAAAQLAGIETLQSLAVTEVLPAID